jgi:hypothetical protein
MDRTRYLWLYVIIPFIVGFTLAKIIQHNTTISWNKINTFIYGKQ